jgi:hypothetical protein
MLPFIDSVVKIQFSNCHEISVVSNVNLFCRLLTASLKYNLVTVMKLVLSVT